MFDIKRETRRLMIRPVRREDYALFVSGFQGCQSALNRFDEQFDTRCMTREWFDALITRRQAEAERDDAYKFHIFDKAQTRSLGYCNIFPHYRGDYQYAHIGYAILNPYWGRGYATECIAALTDIGFAELGLHRLEAHVNLDNPASKRALTKAGYLFEGVRKAYILEDGVWTDNEVYYVTNPGSHCTGGIEPLRRTNG